MMALSPRKIELAGTSEEIGFNHGRLLEKEIKSQIKIYTAMFQVTSSLSWPEVLDIAVEFRDTIERLTPDIYDEMAGIARGADVDLLDIIALNCRSEIALGHFTDGCTSLSWHDSERTLLAQNWDWVAAVKKNLAMLLIEKVGKPKIWMVTEAGIVGKIGFNSEAVGVCLNAIRAKPVLRSKIPVHVALRICLESESVDKAVSQLECLGSVASSQHILLADWRQAVGMELSPLGNVFLKADQHGNIWHTNHFLQNKLVEEPPWLSGSPVRLERVETILSELRTEGVSGNTVTRDLLRSRVFSDTYNSPQAICCEEDPERPAGTRSSTLFNIVMSLEKDHPSAEIVWGKPGSGEEGAILEMPWK